MPSHVPQEPSRSQVVPSVNGHHPVRANDQQSQGLLHNSGPSSKMVAAVRSRVRDPDAKWTKPTADSAIAKAEQM